MLEKLKEEVCKANLDLVKYGMVIFTWGNVSGIDRKTGLVVIKPSGVAYDNMKADDMVVVGLDGKLVEGNYKPSSDTATHIELYKEFPNIGGVVHTHSEWATSFAQAGIGVPAVGTTHADYFYGDIPCTRKMEAIEIQSDYELNTGKVIVECFKDNKLNADQLPAVLVNNHAPFTWGTDAHDAVHNAVVLEEISKMTFRTLQLNAAVKMDKVLLDKHFLRKHGANAYYGQDK